MSEPFSSPAAGFPWRPLTGRERRRYERAVRRFAATAHRPPRLPLPRRTRVRLAITHAINSIGIWLVNHRHYDAALWLWRERRR